MVHGHKQRGVAITLLGGLLHPVQMGGLVFIGFGVAIEVMAVGVVSVGVAGLQCVFEMIKFVLWIQIGQMTVAGQLPHFDGPVKVLACFFGIGFPA